MKEVKIGTHKVELYESIEDLPVTRYHRFNKFMLIDAGIGSDLTSLDTRIAKAIAFINAKDNQSAIIELYNLRQGVFLMQGEITPRHLAFAALVKSIDGVDRNDFSESGIKETLNLLQDCPVKEMDKQIDEIKKKLDSEIEAYVPSLLESSRVKEYYDKLRDKAVAVCEAYLQGRKPDEDPEVRKITNELLIFSKPSTFFGESNEEIRQDKDFEYACLTISQHLHSDAKNFTTLEYYNALNYIKDMSKEHERRTKKLKG